MARLVERNADEACAVIIEPLVQCAGGIYTTRSIWSACVRPAIPTGSHLIADEVAVAFGRTGCLFACQRAGYRALRLGPRVLRTETAAVAALSAPQALWGDLG